jgi:hypothetical protein
MRLDDVPGNVEPETEARVRPLGNALERLEDAIDVLRSDPDPSVGYGDSGGLWGWLPHPDYHRLPVAVFDRIRNHIADRFMKQQRISVDLYRACR